MDFGASMFEGSKQISIPQECDVVFVSDNFVEDYVGGAELTSEALIQSSPFVVFKLRSKEVTLKTVSYTHLTLPTIYSV